MFNQIVGQMKRMLRESLGKTDFSEKTLDRFINLAVARNLRMGPNGTTEILISITKEDILNLEGLPDAIREQIIDEAKETAGEAITGSFLDKIANERLWKGMNVVGKVLDPIVGGHTEEQLYGQVQQEWNKLILQMLVKEMEATKGETQIVKY